jgi:hypothetical protein
VKFAVMFRFLTPEFFDLDEDDDILESPAGEFMNNFLSKDSPDYQGQRPLNAY